MKRYRPPRWEDSFSHIHAKIGTGPMTIVWVTPETVLKLTGPDALGMRIEFYEVENGRLCTGLVDRLDPIPFICRM